MSETIIAGTVNQRITCPHCNAYPVCGTHDAFIHITEDGSFDVDFYILCHVCWKESYMLLKITTERGDNK